MTSLNTRKEIFSLRTLFAVEFASGLISMSSLLMLLMRFQPSFTVTPPYSHDPITGVYSSCTQKVPKKVLSFLKRLQIRLKIRLKAYFVHTSDRISYVNVLGMDGSMITIPKTQWIMFKRE